jgi:hypothetical protein
MRDHPWEDFVAEFKTIRGEPYRGPERPEPVYLGAIPEEAEQLGRARDAARGRPSVPQGQGHGRLTNIDQGVSWAVLAHADGDGSPRW